MVEEQGGVRSGMTYGCISLNIPNVVAWICPQLISLSFRLYLTEPYHYRRR